MRRVFRIDPLMLSVGIFVAVVALTMAAVAFIGSDQAGFADACRTMGGVPLIGHESTKVCFKTDVVLSVN